MELFFATGNKNKVKELAALIRDMNIHVLSIDDAPDYISPPETGVSFKENAFIKAKNAAEFTGIAALADDSGLVVPSLNGAPGVYSSRYSGEEGNDDANNEKLLREMKDLPPEKRDAYFCTVLCLYLPDGSVYYSEGKVEGTILFDYCGVNGFGYDPLFFVKEKGKGMAEMTLEEKNEISHRSRAFSAMKATLSRLLTVTP